MDIHPKLGRMVKATEGGIMKWRLNRESKRKYLAMNKKQLLEHMPLHYNEAYNDGVRDAFMSLLLKLHDEFQFGNERTMRLLKACEPWMQACISGEEDIDSDKIKEQLIQEGLVCLKLTDL